VAGGEIFDFSTARMIMEDFEKRHAPLPVELARKISAAHAVKEEAQWV